jgi:hypothetical protein
MDIPLPIIDFQVIFPETPLPQQQSLGTTGRGFPIQGNDSWMVTQ